MFYIKLVIPTISSRLDLDFIFSTKFSGIQVPHVKYIRNEKSAHSVPIYMYAISPNFPFLVTLYSCVVQCVGGSRKLNQKQIPNFDEHPETKEGISLSRLTSLAGVCPYCTFASEVEKRNLTFSTQNREKLCTWCSL